MRLLLLVFLLLSTNLFAQNLVNNPGFEVNTSQPIRGNQLNLATGWSNCNGYYDTTSFYGTPDYFSTLGTAFAQLPNSGPAYIFPHSGNCIMGEVLFDSLRPDYREYSRTFLTAPMVIGQTYNVSFYTSSGQSNWSGEYSCNNLGILLSTDSAMQYNKQFVIYRTPQLNVTSVVTSTGWTQYAFVYKADSAYKYITIGNFYPDSETIVSLTFPTGATLLANYFFDDIAIQPVDSSKDTTICLGNPVTLTSRHLASYAWRTTTDTAVFSTDSAVTVTPAISTTYLVAGSGVNDTVKVTVIAPPVLTVSPNQTICTGSAIQLVVSGAASYVWQPSTGLSCSTCDTTKSIPGGSTTYYVTGSIGTCTNTDSVIITEVPPPVISISPDTTICLGNSVQLFAEADYDITWYSSPGLSCTTCNDPIATPTATTTYVATTTDGNCTATDSVTITVTTIALTAGTTQAITFGATAQLTAGGAQRYSWQPGSSLNNDTISNPVASPTATTTYIVTGTDIDGCKGTDTVIIYVVTPCSAIKFANAFIQGSENGNGTFKAMAPPTVTLVEFNIYNRWGQRVFETNDINNGWDGTFNGTPEQVDVYVYYAKFICNGTTELIKGNVTLLR